VKCYKKWKKEKCFEMSKKIGDLAVTALFDDEDKLFDRILKRWK